MRRIIEHGIRDGAFRRVDAKVAMFAILGAINWVARWYRPEGALDAATIGAQFADHLVGGLAPRAEAARRAPAPRRARAPHAKGGPRMKALRLTAGGAPLVLEDVPLPVPGADEVPRARRGLRRLPHRHRLLARRRADARTRCRSRSGTR